MKKLLSVCLAAVLVPLAYTSGADAPAAAAKPAAEKKAEKKNPNLRIWKSVSGAVIEAEYVESKFGKVVLRGLDGKNLTIPLHRLVPKDRAWIKEKVAIQSGPVTVKEPKAPNKLPVFSGGKLHNYHAGYSAKNFDALVDENGNILIHLKDKGKRVGKPITYGLRCYYIDTSITTPAHTGRPIAKLSYVPQPKVQPDQITLCGLLRDLVSFNITFEFSEKGIKSSGYCTDPSDIRDKTTFRLGASVPPSHNFTNDDSIEKRAEILKGWRVVADTVAGKKREFEYSDSIQGMGVSAKTIRVAAPVYGSRRVRFTAGDEDAAPLRPYIYPGYCPWQGYFVGMYKKEQGDRSAKISFSMLVQ